MNIKITGESEDIAVLLMTLMGKEKTPPSGEGSSKLIDKEFLDKITASLDSRKAKRDNP